MGFAFPPEGEIDFRGKVVRTTKPPEDWVPKPGDRVLVRHQRDPEKEWLGDWAGEVCYVQSIGVCPRSQHFPYLDATLCSSWPPKLSDLSDGFEVGDLLPWPEKPLTEAEQRKDRKLSRFLRWFWGVK